jgi:hypothetical protein
VTPVAPGLLAADLKALACAKLTAANISRVTTLANSSGSSLLLLLPCSLVGRVPAVWLIG